MATVRSLLLSALVGGCLLGCVHWHGGRGVHSPSAASPTSPRPAAAAAGAGGASTYDHAVSNASRAVEGKIARDLVPITPGNEELVWKDSKLLVITWKGADSYEKYLKDEHATSEDPANVVWVTAAPQVQRFCQDYMRRNPKARRADLELRLKQYLGLDESWSYDLFVELWVSPEDLFRPCVDPEIDDRSCALRFSKDAPVVRGIPDYPAFYKNLYFADFRYGPGVPWTGLGYTYDWGNPLTIQGASEFIIRPGAPYAIEGATKTERYCRPDAG